MANNREKKKMGMRLKENIYQSILWFFLLLIAATMILPFLYVLTISFTDASREVFLSGVRPHPSGQRLPEFVEDHGADHGDRSSFKPYAEFRSGLYAVQAHSREELLQ